MAYLIPFYQLEPFAGLWATAQRIIGEEFANPENIHLTGDWDKAVEHNLEQLALAAVDEHDGAAYELLRDWAGSRCAYSDRARFWRDEARTGLSLCVPCEGNIPLRACRPSTCGGRTCP